MLIIVLFLPPLLGIALFYALANLVQKMIDKKNTKDQKLLCAVLTFVFIFVLRYCNIILYN